MASHTNDEQRSHVPQSDLQRPYTDTQSALDVIKTADWLIDLGPEGGAGGGKIIATGTPEEVAKNPASVTGKYLAPLLKKNDLLFGK